MSNLDKLYADPRYSLIVEMLTVLDSSRIWGGTGYVYHPISPVKYLPLKERLELEMEALSKEYDV